MANSFVTLNGKQYVVARTRYEPKQTKYQRVHLTVGGDHVSQNFGVVESRWGFDLRAPYIGDATWGSLDDLKAAYALDYVSFTDHYGSTHDVFFEGEFIEQPDLPLIDQSAMFTIPVNLLKKRG